jgi:tetratricopeptide (TPR) repeat protein
MPRLDEEHDDLRAALNWCRDSGSVEAGLDLAVRLWRFWNLRGHRREGLARLEDLLARGPASPSVRARALNAAGNLAWPMGELERAAAAYGEALALHRSVGNDVGVVTTLDGLASVARLRGRLPEALDLGEEVIALARRLDDRYGLAMYLNNYAITLMHAGQPARATALHEEALAIRRELGDAYGVGMSLLNLANLARAAGEHERQGALARECIDLCRASQNMHLMTYALAKLGDWARDGADADSAREHYLKGLGLALRTPEPTVTATCLEGLAALSAAEGRADDAALLYAVAAALRERIGLPLPAAYRGEHDQMVARLREAPGQQALAAAWVRGSSLTPEEALAVVGLAPRAG